MKSPDIIILSTTKTAPRRAGTQQGSRKRPRQNGVGWLNQCSPNKFIIQPPNNSHRVIPLPWGTKNTSALLRANFKTAVPFGGTNHSNSKWFVPKTGLRYYSRKGRTLCSVTHVFFREMVLGNRLEYLVRWGNGQQRPWNQKQELRFRQKKKKKNLRKKKRFHSRAAKREVLKLFRLF